MSTVTVEARLLAIGDKIAGERVTAIDNSYMPRRIDVALHNDATGVDRVVSLNRHQWVQVIRG
jgi:hypothetical protein